MKTDSKLLKLCKFITDITELWAFRSLALEFRFELFITSALPMGFSPWLSRMQTDCHLIVWWLLAAHEYIIRFPRGRGDWKQTNFSDNTMMNFLGSLRSVPRFFLACQLVGSSHYLWVGAMDRALRFCPPLPRKACTEILLLPHGAMIHTWLPTVCELKNAFPSIACT